MLLHQQNDIATTSYVETVIVVIIVNRSEQNS